MKKIIAFLVCLSCAYMIIHPLRLLFDGGQAISMLVPSVLIILVDRLFLNRSILVAFLYSVIVLLLLSSGVEYFETYLSQLVAMFFSIGCFLHYLKTKDEFFAKAILITYFASFVIMAIVSIPQFYLFPEMTRQLLLAENEGGHVDAIFYWSLAYSSMHEIPLLIIPLIALFKSSVKKSVRLIVIVSIVILLVALMLGDATTPFLLSLIIVFVLMVYKKKQPFSNNIRRLAFISVALALLLNKVVLVALLGAIQPIFEGTTNYTKVEEVKEQLVTGNKSNNKSLNNREAVYKISEDTFWSHPFGIEKDEEKIGKHSFIIDHFAVLGLFFIIPFLALIYLRYRNVIIFLKSQKYFFIVAYFAFLILAYFKNFFIMIDAWFIVPMFLLYLEKNNIEYDLKKNSFKKVVQLS